MDSPWLSRVGTACCDANDSARFVASTTPATLRRRLSLLAWTGSSSGEIVALLDLLHSDSYQDRLGGLCNEKGTQHLKGYSSLESRGWE